MGRTANPNPRTRCSSCGAEGPTPEYVAKRVIFTTVGKPVTTIRSRTVDHLCPRCRDADEVWASKPYDTPGTRRASRKEPTNDQS